jgi:hypothetical protein
MLGTTSYIEFLAQAASSSYKAHPTNAQSLYDMVQEDPALLRWPILVNYATQEIGRDHDEVRGILKTLVVARDGKPKGAPAAAAPPRRMAPRPEPATWVDYD